jgi:hypothetical protein
MKIRIFLLIILFNTFLYAQDKPDTLLNTWIPKGVSGLNISQIAFSDWSQGGDNSITYSIFGVFGLNYYTESWGFKNNLKVTYGQTKIGDASYKTNDNEFYLETIFSLKFGWTVDPFFSNTVRTSITAGYKYSGDTAKTKIADIFDPGYITQSIGFTYDKDKIFKSRLGIAIQETFTNNQRQYSDDPVTTNEIESFKLETGIESVSDLNLPIDVNLLYTSKLRLFTRFDHLDVWDVRWDNQVTAKINSWLNVNFNFIAVYERSQSVKTQIKEALQVGVAFNLF